MSYQREDERIVEVNGVEYVVAQATAKLRVIPSPVVKAVASKVDGEITKDFWQDGENTDIVWAQFILDAEGENQNWDYMPRPVMMASFGTAKFKPFDMDHVIKESGKSMVFVDPKKSTYQNTIFGVMTDSALAKSDGTILTPKEITALKTTDVFGRPDDEKLAVVGIAALWNFCFPKTVGDVVNYARQGAMHVSMERWIHKYDFLYRTEKGTLASISKAKAIENGYHEMWAKRKKVNDAPILRRSLKFVYGGVASTMTPANELSTFLNSGPEQAVASAVANNPALKNLVMRHDEVHRAYAVSTDEGEKASLSRENAWLHECIAKFKAK
jgi:hypothetical protein